MPLNTFLNDVLQSKTTEQVECWQSHNKRKDAVRAFQSWLRKAREMELEREEERRPRQGDAARVSEEAANVVRLFREKP